MAFRPPIGESDFRVIRREGLTYVDKTGWVVDVLEDPARGCSVALPG